VHILAGNRGIVLGTLFTGGGANRAAPPDFDELESRRIIASGGQRIVDAYWGSYVAFLYDESTEQHCVFRDPTAMHPCYHTSCDGVEVFFSDIEDCINLLHLPFSVDEQYLARWFIIYTALAYRETGIANVGESLAGEALVISRHGARSKVLWNPGDIAAVPSASDRKRSAEDLRSTVQATVSAWASRYARITHHLSGGLDSSIVAACLAQSTDLDQLSFLNFSPVPSGCQELSRVVKPAQSAARIRALGGTGDERYFARLVAEKCSVPLAERHYVSTIDMASVPPPPLRVMPTVFYAARQIDDVEIALTRTSGVEAFFSGEAGDSMFLATSRALAPIDYAWMHGIDAGFWQHLLPACRLSRQSVFSVLRESVKHGVMHRPLRPRSSPFDLPTLLKDDLVERFDDNDFESPLTAMWCGAALPPGKINHVKGLGSLPYYHGVFRSGRFAHHVNPLNSQPVWEIALRTPVYSLLAGGASRGLARQAFADLLPREIAVRQSKGTGSPLLQQWIRQNLSFVHATLREGVLVRDGYLDRQKIDACFSAEEPFMHADPHNLAQSLVAELWVRQWQEVSARAVDRARAQRLAASS